MANASSLFGRQAPTKASARCHGRAAAASRAPQSPCCRTLRRSAAAERLKTHANDENAVTASEHGEFDVSGAVVNPVFRSTPWEEEARQDAGGGRDGGCVRLLFVSESGVCRGPLSEAIMIDLLEAHGLASTVACESRGSKDYNVGDAPDAALQAVAQELELRLPEGAAARQFDHERDIVAFDLVLVMDKYTAADVLREVSVYDTINKAGNYSAKVRMLGEYHKQLGTSREPDGQDIDDPLYGNAGGAAEQEAVRRTAMIISEACNGLLDFLQQTKGAAAQRGGSFRDALGQAVGELEAIDWMVPPMLQKN